MKVGGLSLEGNPRFDPYHLFVSSVPYMIDGARFAAGNEAHSYRNFLVGAAVFALQPATQETDVFFSGNLKASRGKEKVCAEKKALNKAQKAGFTRVLGIAVVATTDRAKIEEVTHMPTATLHPCDDCLTMFEGHSQVRDDTLVVTAGIDVDIYEVHTHKELHDIAVNNEFPATEQVYRGLDNWRQRVDMYDYMFYEQQKLDGSKRTPYAELARIALTAPLRG